MRGVDSFDKGWGARDGGVLGLYDFSLELGDSCGVGGEQLFIEKGAEVVAAVGVAVAWVVSSVSDDSVKTRDGIIGVDWGCSDGRGGICGC